MFGFGDYTLERSVDTCKHWLKLRHPEPRVTHIYGTQDTEGGTLD